MFRSDSGGLEKDYSDVSGDLITRMELDNISRDEFTCWELVDDFTISDDTSMLPLEVFESIKGSFSI